MPDETKLSERIRNRQWDFTPCALFADEVAALERENAELRASASTLRRNSRRLAEEDRTAFERCSTQIRQLRASLAAAREVVEDVRWVVRDGSYKPPELWTVEMKRWGIRLQGSLAKYDATTKGAPDAEG